MLSEMGSFFLVMAVGFACVQSLASFWGVYKDNNRFLTLGRTASYLHGGFVCAAFLTLVYAFFICDFSISTVALNSHTKLPWYYRLAATWGNHEGSLLLFVLVLSLISVAFSYFLPSTQSLMKARVLVIQGILSVGFLLFLMLTSNPFAALPFALPEGNSLNPLLQDKGLLIHPPILYLGYVGFSAPFSLAVAALWGEETIKVWTNLARRWVLFAWAALTAGITLGSWWAYYELGWGGWWFWDPVENASFMPWLAGTALLHTLRTGRLYRWSLFLSILTFELSLLGTFLVRSGLVASVHAFAQDSYRSFFFLYFLLGTFIFSIGFWLWKRNRLQSSPVNFLSTQGALLLNSLLMFAGLLTILLGTLYPLGSDLFFGTKVAVGAPYFERTFIPLMIPLLALIPLGLFFNGKVETLFSLLIIPFTLTLGVVVYFLYWISPPSLWVLLGVGVGVWVLGGTIVAYIKNRLSFGSTLAHVGVGIALLGVSIGGGFRVDESHVLGLKESLNVTGVQFTLEEVQQGNESTYFYEKAILSSPRGTLTPEKRLYLPQGSLLSETAILSNGFRDIYVILGPYQGDSKWLIRVSSIPLAPWIWIGGAFMVLGAILSWFKKQGVVLLITFFLPIVSYAEASIDIRAQEFFKEVRCPVCSGQSIADSQNLESRALKTFILEKMQKGQSEETIRDDLRDQFGDDILFRPPVDLTTLFLWGMPFILFFVVAFGFLWKAYRSQTK